MKMHESSKEILLNDDDSRNGVVLDNISIRYRRSYILQNLAGTFHQGSMTAIVGPNGGGKTTLLRAIRGDVPLQGGQINLPASLKQIAYLPQSNLIDRTFPLTAGEVVAMGLCAKADFFKALGSDTQDRVAEALRSVGLKTALDTPIGSLSGGQFQRVLFARLALQRADLILMDEPFSAIDLHTMEDLVAVLKGWQARGQTIIVVSHDLDIIEEHFPETLLLARGALGWGPTQDVLTKGNLMQAKNLARTWEI